MRCELWGFSRLKAHSQYAAAKPDLTSLQVQTKSNTWEQREGLQDTLQNYSSPWQATFIVIKHIFLLCRKSPSWIFLYGDLAQDKTHRGCCEGTHRCCGAARRLSWCLPWIQECTSGPQQHSFQPLCLRNLQYSAVQRQDYFIWALKIPHEPHWYGVQHTVTNDLQRFCPSCSTPDAARLRRGGSLSSEAPPVFSVAGTWEVRSGRLVYCSSGLLFAVLKYLNSQEAAVT